MTATDHPLPDITLDVDLRNPGQFFACCGLLELASRLWPGSEANGWRDPEGWFDISASQFAISTPQREADLAKLISELRNCELSSLSAEETTERDFLESKRRELKRQGKELEGTLERRRKALGSKARKGSLRLGTPFQITLDWWDTGESNEDAEPANRRLKKTKVADNNPKETANDDNVPVKTWAGRQEIHKIARACQEALLGLDNVSELFEFTTYLRVPAGYRTRANAAKTVECFYFDARRFANALDIGYSLDVLEANTLAYPGVELLCLIGLQRFRPKVLGSNLFLYQCWSTPLSCAVAPIAASATFTKGQCFHFRRLYRDDQKRYKAFDFATDKGERLWQIST